jgi:hypothetical protein
MKKLFMLATVAFLVTGVTFANDGGKKGKGKSCCSKSTSCKKGASSSCCHHDDAAKK